MDNWSGNSDEMAAAPVEAEQAAIGAFFIDDGTIAIAATKIRPEQFSQHRHRLIVAAAFDMFRRGETVDLTTLSVELRAKGQLDEIGSSAYLAECFYGCAGAANFEAYLKPVLEYSAKQSALLQLQNTTADIRRGSVPVSQALSDLQKSLSDIGVSQATGRLEIVREIVPALMENFRKRREHTGQVVGVPSGFRDVDEQLGGWRDTELSIIAARPSQGKTAFMLNMARHIALQEKRLVAIFSLEMQKLLLLERLVADVASVDALGMQRARIGHAEWDRAADALMDIGEAPIAIDDISRATPMQMRSKLYQLEARHGKPAIVMVDYLQIAASDVRKDSRYQEVGEIAQGLKEIAKEFTCPVVALAQLSRKCEEREDKRPLNSDLGESGQIETIADVVSFLFRPNCPAYRRKRPMSVQFGAELPDEADNVAEFIIGKQRNGPVGTVKLGWAGEFTRFSDFQENGLGGYNRSVS